MRYSKRVDFLLERCKQKAIDHTKVKGNSVNWSQGNLEIFSDILDNFFDEVLKNFYVKRDGRTNKILKPINQDEVEAINRS